MKKDTHIAASERSDKRKIKRAYHTPKLIVYGRVADLTASKSASGFDSNHKKTGFLH
jgi:hypothetical protein